MINLLSVDNSEVKLTSPDSIIMQGDLTFATVAKIAPAAEKIMQQCATICYVDLQAVGHSDSAGLGLLIHLVRQAKQSFHKTLHFVNVPTQIRKLAQFSGVEFILFASYTKNE